MTVNVKTKSSSKALAETSNIKNFSLIKAFAGSNQTITLPTAITNYAELMLTVNYKNVPIANEPYPIRTLVSSILPIGGSNVISNDKILNAVYIDNNGARIESNVTCTSSTKVIGYTSGTDVHGYLYGKLK